MQEVDGDLERNGFCILRQAIDDGTVRQLIDVLGNALAEDSTATLARSSRGHVYAARNLIESVPEVVEVWQTKPILAFLDGELGGEFGLVRVLFFDKPPDRSWSLPWHKDTSIAVKDNTLRSATFSRPTVKAGVPHVIAPDTVLQSMLTLRLHLDEVTSENGPLLVVPGSHVSSASFGVGFDRSETIFAKPGDVLAMRPLISHSSGASAEGTRRHRRILHLEFAASSELPDDYQWHDFIRPKRLASSDT